VNTETICHCNILKLFSLLTKTFQIFSIDNMKVKKAKGFTQV